MRLLFAAAIAAQCFAGVPAFAMEFEIGPWRGHEVLYATGPIEDGDAERLERVLPSLPELPHGVPVMLLDSPGGFVGEAEGMAQLLDRREIHTVIPEGADCASACASVLFLAGKYRTVDFGGRLGQHSCSLDGVADSDCNEMIAAAAVGRGVPHGAVMAVLDNVGPDDINWMGRDAADCWGITVYPFSDETGYERSDPCAVRTIAEVMGTGGDNFPPAQSSWRVDFLEDGYRAFLRPAADHMRELELSLYCIESVPGLLFLSMDIGGPAEAVDEVIGNAFVAAGPIFAIPLAPAVVQVDDVYSRAIVPIPKAQTLPFLTEARTLNYLFEVAPGYQPIVARTMLEGSREALIFAANNCKSDFS